MRSITFVQAFQYWLKLTALLVPAAVLLVVWAGDRAPASAPAQAADWSVPLARPAAQGLYITCLADRRTFLGTMGCPTWSCASTRTPDGRAAAAHDARSPRPARIFYLLPPVYGALGRIYAPSSRRPGAPTRSSSSCPPDGAGLAASLLTGLVTAGAFAAFLSTSSGSRSRWRGAQPGRHRQDVRRLRLRGRRRRSGSAP
jgi:hypothetical protein